MDRGTIAARLFDALKDKASRAVVQDVRIGLGYVGVALDNGSAGLAAVLRRELAGGCSTLSGAGTLAGMGAEGVLALLVEGTNPLEKALGLATANALIGSPEGARDGDSIELMKLTPQDKVGMAGFFGPLIQRIRKMGIELTVLEKDHSRGDVPDEETGARILRACSVVIITATTILNDTLEETLALLGSPRHVAILGPSTPMTADIFRDTPVTHLGGSVVADVPKVLQVISEGGGTPEMRPYLRFVNVMQSEKKAGAL